MKYPTSVVVKGHTYKIEYVDTHQEVDADFEDRLWLGQCADGVLRILNQREHFDVMDTLIHEIMHAVFNRNRLLKASLKSSDLEEPFIDALASELAVLLSENGWLGQPEESPPITRRIVLETK